LAFLRTFEHERVLVVANLSRTVQFAALNLAEFQGLTPLEVLGRTPFPRIGREPYVLTLGPYSFYWFAMTEHRPGAFEPGDGVHEWPARPAAGRARPAAEALADLLRGPGLRAFDRALARHLPRRAWFRSHGRVLRSARVTEVVPLPHSEPACAVTLVRV